jgi:DNA mismatch endonuclease (patch repair protein)
MRGNRKRDTRPELLLRRAVHRFGLRYRVATRPLPNRPWTADLVFRSARVAVFVDGCFWHGCPEHYGEPRTNTGYWAPKIARNRERDEVVTRELCEAGWTVVRIWEHEDVAVATERVVFAVTGALGR